jgi:hypothetical protein
MKLGTAVSFFAMGIVPLAVVVACGSSAKRSNFEGGDDAAGGFGDGSNFEGGEGGGNIGGRDPVNCQEAAQFKTYVGCDYWPTVTGNPVQEVFDFAVAVANVGSDVANITITGPGGVNEKISVAGGDLGKVYLPWVKSLKGPQVSTTVGTISAMTASVFEAGGAYHLVSDKPVVVYQFSALEYKATGGKPGKNWSSCVKPDPSIAECYSYSNDASLLLPSTAMTGNYRVMGTTGWSSGFQALTPPTLTVTGTAADTNVSIKLTQAGQVVAGGTITATPGGGTVTFKLNAGDVAEVVGGVGDAFDFSGSLIKADKPVQVISGSQCMNVPANVPACDHLEETQFPAETLGKHYVVTRPTGPRANEVGHVVRFYGNVDGTTLTYAPSKPGTCPDFLNAGQVAECGLVSADFEVSGDHEFGVSMFMLGGAQADPMAATLAQPLGDPSISFAVTVEQYRKRYVFLAPTDYVTNYVDIVAAVGTTVTLDGADVSSKLKALTGTQYLIGRIALDAGKAGVHTLDASEPIGIQVLGYGDNTSYQYPGGLNLSSISAIPVK